MRYFDASALVKRYVREPAAVSVRRLLKSDRAATSRLSEVEVASALTRRAREGAFTVQYVTIHGYRRAFLSAGHGPPLLLIHGIESATRRQWHRV